MIDSSVEQEAQDPKESQYLAAEINGASYYRAQ